MAFNALHARLSGKYGHAYSPDDFYESLKILEGSFITIAAGQISFINPSFRDYLTEYLTDGDLLSAFAPCASSARWARALWRHFLKVAAVTSGSVERFASLFIAVAGEFKTWPIWKTSEENPRSMEVVDLSTSERLKLILEWWDLTRIAEFASVTLEIVGHPRVDFTSWLDGENLVELIRGIKERSKEFPDADMLCLHLEEKLIEVLDGYIPADNLPEICDAIEEARDNLSAEVAEAAGRAIRRQIDEADTIASEIDSESTLDDHIEAVKRLGKRVEVSSDRLEAAIATYQGRIAEIQQSESEAEEPSFTGSQARERDRFDDKAMTDLFSLLLDRS